VTKQQNQEASAGVSVFTRSRRAAAAVAFSLGLGSLVYGTVLALPADAAAGAVSKPVCSTPGSPTATSPTGGTSPTTSPTDGASASATASASASASATGGTADSGGPASPLCTPLMMNPSSTDASGSASSTPTGARTGTPAPSKSTKSSAPAKGGPTSKPPKATGTRTVPVYVVSPTGSYFVYTDVPPGNADYQLPHGTISRAQIMARAQLWVQDQVPYSESNWFTDPNGTYRQDCSGYVSMAWDLNQSTDFWTGNLNLVSHTIPAAELLPGDILLSDKHTILFAGWADAAHTSFDYYEESHPGTVAHYVTDAPLGAFLDNGFAPFRFDGVTNSSTLPANPLGVAYSTLIQQGSEVDPAGVGTGQPPSRPASQSSSADRIAAQAAADDIADSGGQTQGGALAVGGAFLIGAGVLMRRPALQARKRRH
jgi:hypothetical protein